MTRVTKPESVLVRELAGELVLLNLDNECYFGLDEVGARMWAAVTGSSSIEKAHEILLAEYDVDPEQLRADVDAFVQDLAAAGLVLIADALPREAA